MRLIKPKYRPWRTSSGLRYPCDRAAARAAYRDGAHDVIRISFGEIGEQSSRFRYRRDGVPVYISREEYESLENAGAVKISQVGDWRSDRLETALGYELE